MDDVNPSAELHEPDRPDEVKHAAKVASCRLGDWRFWRRNMKRAGF